MELGQVRKLSTIDKPAADQHKSYEAKHLNVDRGASASWAADRVERSLKC